MKSTFRDLEKEDSSRKVLEIMSLRDIKVERVR